MGKVKKNKLIGDLKIPLFRLNKILRLKDPYFKTFKDLAKKGIIKIVIEDNCEMVNESEIAEYLNVENLNEPFLVVNEVAQILEIPEYLVRRFAQKGLLPSYRLGKNPKGSLMLFKRSEIEHARDMIFTGTLVKHMQYINMEKRLLLLQGLFKENMKFLFDQKIISRLHHDVMVGVLCQLETYESLAKRYEYTGEGISRIFIAEYKKMFNISSRMSGIVVLNRELKEENFILLSQVKKMISEHDHDFAEKIKVEYKAKQKAILYATPIYEFSISGRCRNYFRNFDVPGKPFTFGDLMTFSIKKLETEQHLGAKSIRDLILLVEEKGERFTDYDIYKKKYKLQ